jgi:O-antigen/teichoic acid export membrane protein
MSSTSEAALTGVGSGVKAGADSSSAASRVVGTPGFNAPRSLKLNAVWTIAGNGVYAASQWLQVAIIAHLGTTVDVGQYALTMGICAPVFMLSNLQLRSIQATDSVRRYSFGEYLGLRLITSAGALVFALVLSLLFARNGSLAVLTVAIAVYKALESISDIYQGSLQQRERMDYLSQSFMWKALLVVSCFGVTYHLTQNLLFAVFAMATGQLLSLWVYDIPVSTRTMHGLAGHDRTSLSKYIDPPDWNREALRRLAQRALPLGLTMMLVSLYANLPRFVLEKYAGASAVGIFAAITYFTTVGTMIVNAVGAAVCPRLALHVSRSEGKEFWVLVIRLALLAAAIGAAGIIAALFAGHYVLLTFYGHEYARHTDVLIWSMLGAAFLYVSSVFGYAATARGRLAGQPWIVAISCAVLLGCSAALVPAHGLVGAAISIAVAALSNLAGFVVLVCGRTRRDDNPMPKQRSPRGGNS